MGGAPLRSGATLVLDQNDRRVVVFGGTDDTGAIPDRRQWLAIGEPTARYMALRWTYHEGEAVEGPGWRRGHTALYDATRDRMVVFGGYDESGRLAAGTYALSLSEEVPLEWRPIDAPAGPSPRWGHGAAFDARQDRMVVFGGRSDTDLDDVWVLSFQGQPPRWHKVVVHGGPSPRYLHSLSIAAGGMGSDVLVAYGGTSGCNVMGDMWLLTIDDDLKNGQWLQIEPTGRLSPGPRFGHAAGFAGYDLHVVGGQKPGFRYDSTDMTWVLNTANVEHGRAVSWRVEPTMGGPPKARQGGTLVWMNGLYPGWFLSLFGGYSPTGGAPALWSYVGPGDPLPPPEFTPPPATATPARTPMVGIPPGAQGCPTLTPAVPTATPEDPSGNAHLPFTRR